MSMKFIKQLSILEILLLVITAIVLFMSCNAHANSENINPNPIFEGYYESRKVHFEMLKTSVLLPNCKKFLTIFKPLPRQLILYAKYQYHATSIYIVGANLSSGIFVIRDGACDSGSADFSLRQMHSIPSRSEESPVLADAEVRGLFQDALVRHEKAFGGKIAFLMWLEDTTDEWKEGGCKTSSEQYCREPELGHPVLPFVLKILNSYRSK